jgi:hypothetical protein
MSDLRNEQIHNWIWGLVLLALSAAADAQSVTVAARQVLAVPRDIQTIAIWPAEVVDNRFSAGLAVALSDEIEQAVSRKAREMKIKVMSRRQLQSVLSELKLTSTDFQDFDSLAKSNGVDAIILISTSFMKINCLSVGLKALGTSEGNKAEVISAAKPFQVKVQRDEIDMAGCDD